ncbi:MAG: High-affinity Fe2+/Pb2+ permease [Rickettsiaceae bacterium]|jgi:high-affinity iron transporter|nr:High-affinity Fe2+/Pb2+ permease [Rickettsiaceae bacterium]
MLSAAIVIFREILEIALILGVVMAATKELAGRNKWVLGGIGLGVIGSGLVAFFASAIANAAEGLGQELFNAMILLTAAAVIGGTALWMGKHAREMTLHLQHVSNEVIAGNMPLYSIALVIALAVLREGAEIVLFVHGMIASGQEISSIITGSAIGFSGGLLVGLALYFGLISISPRYIFKVTTWLLILLCAGMAATASQFLVSAGWFAEFSEQVWDTSAFVSDAGIAGQTLHALFGYTAQPMQIQVIFYAVALGGLVCLMKVINRGTKKLKAA